MLHQVIEKPRFLLRVWYSIRDGLPRPGRYQRYVAAIAPSLAAIWLLTGAYLALAPARYTSSFTLILPGSGVGSSMNVESIGQAQSSASSAFSSTTLSPTENYKRLLMADVTMRQAVAFPLLDLGKAAESRLPPDECLPHSPPPSDPHTSPTSLPPGRNAGTSAIS